MKMGKALSLGVSLVICRSGKLACFSTRKRLNSKETQSLASDSRAIAFSLSRQCEEKYSCGSLGVFCLAGQLLAGNIGWRAAFNFRYPKTGDASWTASPSNMDFG
jgi:hypothetical protein